MNDQTPFPYGKRKARLNEWDKNSWTALDKLSVACMFGLGGLCLLMLRWATL